MQPDDILTASEVCGILKISQPTLSSWIKQGKLRPWKTLKDGSGFLFLRTGIAPTSVKNDSLDKTTARILVVSQEQSTLDQFSSPLRGHNYSVVTAKEFKQLKYIVKNAVPEVVILDLDLKYPSGWQFFSKIRGLFKELGLPQPICFLLSSRKKENPGDAARALKMGAWDFLKRPFAPVVFMARIRLALRRRLWSELDSKPNDYVLKSQDGHLTVDPQRRTLEIRQSAHNSMTLPLTKKESEIICLLLKRTGRIFSKSLLLELIWGYSVNVKTRTIDCHIKNLRQKLGPYASRIETHYRLGYRFIDPLPGSQKAFLPAL